MLVKVEEVISLKELVGEFGKGHSFAGLAGDAFFASVEILDHPEWKNLPVIVGGKPEDRRAVVSTASYEARKYGVHSAMPTAIASRLCPNGIFVHPLTGAGLVSPASA